MDSATEKEITVKDIVLFIRKGISFTLRHWIVVAAVVLAGGATGFFIAAYSPVIYNAKISFVLEDGRQGGGGLSSIAGQFGLDIGAISGGGSNMLAGENIVGLLKSRRFVRQALLSPVDSGKRSLADLYADVYALRSAWKANSRIGTEIYFPPGTEPGTRTRLQDSLLQVIQDYVIKKHLTVEKSDKKMTFYEVQAGFKDEKLSKLFTEQLVKGAVDFYIETKTMRQRTNVDRLQHRADSIEALLNRRTYMAAAAVSRNLDINPAHQTAVVSAELNTRDKMAVGAIYTEIMKNLELQKATLTQVTPVIQIVDNIELPLKTVKPSKRKAAAIGAALGIILLAGILMVRRMTGSVSGKRLIISKVQ